MSLFISQNVCCCLLPAAYCLLPVLQAKCSKEWNEEDVEKEIRKSAGTIRTMAHSTSSVSFGKAKISGVKKVVRQGVPMEKKALIWSLLLNLQSMECNGFPSPNPP